MKILIAEDHPMFRTMLEKQLTRWGYEVVVTEDGNQAWQALQEEDAPRLAIFDWRMPGFDGPTLCRKIRSELPEPYTYIILLTGQDREEDLVLGLEAGADEYILKPFKQNELKARLRAGRRIIELQTELLQARTRLQEKASRDSLTGLWNHGEILRILQQELARAERETGQVTVIMADLDHFKAINDTHGHMAGDAVIRAVAERMQSLIRPYDYIGRYGGEEYLLVLTDSCPVSGADFAERLRQNISEQSVDIAEGIIPVTVGLGVAAQRQGAAGSGPDLVNAADQALYRAKKNGRNRVEVAAELPAAGDSESA